MNRLEAWLWNGSFPSLTERLPVWSPAEGEPEASLLSQVSDTMKSVAKLEERLKNAAAAQGGAPDAERELRAFAKAALPSLDALDRLADFAEKAAKENAGFEPWRESIEGVRGRILKSFERIGLTAIGSVGNKVDLNIHDVVRLERRPGTPPDVVLEESIRGWYFRGRLLRDAKVVVSQ